MDDLLSFSSGVLLTAERFWESLFIWHRRPHLINRNIIAGIIVCTFEIKNHITISDFLNFCTKCQLNNEQPYSVALLSHYEIDGIESSDELIDVSAKQYIQIKKLQYKIKDKYDIEFNLIDGSAKQMVFFPMVNRNHFPYVIRYKNNEIQLLTEKSPTIENRYKTWLISKVLPKIIKWATDNVSDKDEKIQSLSLISTNEYVELYSHLKEKYGKMITEMWTESTDPLKFVYEDIAIATYLCLLWKKTNQKFVDMGCGNGLLVHILSSEGHTGLGLDVRSRKIWDFYPSSTVLKVETITPDSDCLPNDTDWLIGNHSDELTPWIPIKAACNGYFCNFFLLPCCAYEFTGRRYQRRNSSKSLYNDYLTYIRTISEQVGFHVQVDKLRIPSTKRTCLIGQSRNYPIERQCERMDKINDFVKMECRAICGGNYVDEINSNCGHGGVAFVPRKAKEDVRNCTQIDKRVVNAIVKIASDLLVAKQMENKNRSQLDDVWCCSDYSMDLKTIVANIPPEYLVKLKSEGKGIQTLLKNNHHIFLVMNERVQFRKPERQITNDTIRYKRKPCWFYHNHPLRCPLDDNICRFIH